MVEVKHVEVYSLERAKKAIENSFNVGEIDTTIPTTKERLAQVLGSNDQPHQSHDAWLKGVLVMFDMKGNGVVMPEFQRYHFAEIVMSQSTMHSMDKFMNSNYDPFTKYVLPETREIVEACYMEYVKAKKAFEDYEENHPVGGFEVQCVEMQKEAYEERQKLKNDVYEAFETLVHNLPRGFELWATITTNYLELKTIVTQRFHHKNKEDWMSFVAACYEMPEFRSLCGFSDKKWDLSNW